MVDFAWINREHASGTGQREAGDQVKYPVIADILTKSAGQAGAQEVATVIERLVAADARRQTPQADQAQRQRSQRGRNDGAGPVRAPGRTKLAKVFGSFFKKNFFLERKKQRTIAISP